MAMTEISPLGSGFPGSPGGAGGGSLDDIPFEAPALLIQLQDELARSRLREAAWMSIVVHMLVLIGIAVTPHLPGRHQAVLFTAEDLLRQREATFLELPPDEQKVTRKPDTNTISDKDRIAMSRKPTIDRETLEALRDASRPGPPGPGGVPAPAEAASAPPMAGQQRAAGGPPQAGQSAKLETPPMSARQAFGSAAMSAGSAIEQATRAAANSRASGFGGAGGDYGFGTQSRGQIGPMEILSDTMGVDFAPYLARVLHDVKFNWYQLIPEVARPPFLKKGKVSIQFVILKDGQVAGLQIIGPSGDVSLDRAAYGGITASNPFPPLPAEFRGEYLALRFHFYYNPSKGDLD
jgi:TonB family protein